MSAPKKYKVDCFPKPDRADLKDVFRVYMSNFDMQRQNMRPQDQCIVSKEDGLEIKAEAWPETPSFKIKSPNTVLLSKMLQESYGLKLKDHITISKRANPLIQDARSIEVVITTDCESESSQTGTERSQLASHLGEIFYKAGQLSPGLLFSKVNYHDLSNLSFKVSKINGASSPDLFRYVESSAVKIIDEGALPLSLNKDGLIGLEQQLSEIDYQLESMSYLISGEVVPVNPFYIDSMRQNILLHGPRGVGKSEIMKRMLEAGWGKAILVDANDLMNKKEIDRVFEEAIASQPSMIAIDNLESISADSSIIEGKLAEKFDDIQDEKALVMVVGATTDIHSLPRRLRRLGRFPMAIELTAPSTVERARFLRSYSPQDEPSIIDAIVAKTHGFVVDDLKVYMQTTYKSARHRLKAADISTPEVSKDKISRDRPKVDLRARCAPQIIQDDIDAASAIVQPSSMSSAKLETPKVKWSDIGGAEEVKKNLRQAIEWPLHRRDTLQRLGVPSLKGIILYGPPGCSKTLAAKALANETGLNFLAVKGAEVLNMYVGESERKVREIFDAARRASPSILFFDEIDAIGGARESGPGGRGIKGVNVLTTLLNELDGIQELKDVFVLAATNKPESLDPALIRPGRFDRLIYAGPPDKESRLDIFKIRLSKMDVDYGRLGGESDLKESLATATEGFTGAEIVNVCNRAAYAAMEECEATKHYDQKVTVGHFEAALRTVQKQLTDEVIDAYKNWGMKNSAASD